MISRLIGAAVFLAGATTAAKPASFDCAKADADDEIAICRNAMLSALDSEMGGLWYAYRKFPFLMGMSGVRHDAAEAFLRKRSACGSDVACLKSVYEDRIAALRRDIADAIKAMVQEKETAEKQAAAAAPTHLPGPVDDIIDTFDTQCAQLGGTLTNPCAVGVMVGDLDGDARMDYVLNPAPLHCRGVATAFCSNAGCEINVALSGNRYRKPLKVLGGRPTLRQRTGKTDLEIWVDRFHCPGMSRDNACWAVYSWTGGKPDMRYEVRPKPN